jgi:hypothetical protein
METSKELRPNHGTRTIRKLNHTDHKKTQRSKHKTIKEGRSHHTTRANPKINSCIVHTAKLIDLNEIKRRRKERRMLLVYRDMQRINLIL